MDDIRKLLSERGDQMPTRRLSTGNRGRTPSVPGNKRCPHPRGGALLGGASQVEFGTRGCMIDEGGMKKAVGDSMQTHDATLKVPQLNPSRLPRVGHRTSPSCRNHSFITGQYSYVYRMPPSTSRTRKLWRASWTVTTCNRGFCARADTRAFLLCA